MSVTMFAGTFLGTLFSIATQNRRLAICKFLFGRHPFLARTLGVAIVLILLLVPYLALTGYIAIDSTPFFLGGCLVYSFLITFTLTSCTIAQGPQES